MMCVGWAMLHFAMRVASRVESNHCSMLIAVSAAL